MRRSLAFAACALLLGCTRSELTDDPDAGADDAGTDAPTGSDGGTTTPKKIDKVDLLLVVDNSRNVEVAQELFAQTLPYLFGRLVRPACVNGLGHVVAETDSPDDPCPVGQREFAPLRDVHVGVLSTSLGGHGADICSPMSPSYTEIQDDKGRLLARSPLGDTVATYEGKGFLAWDPGQALSPPGEADEAALLSRLDMMVHGVGQGGCGFESQLESTYRFLVDPEPYEAIPVIDGKAVPQGIDQILLQQRADFLRFDSAVVVMLVTDENDCSLREGGQYFYAAQGSSSGSQFHLPRARSECDANQNDACCASCGQETPSGCPPTASDPSCLLGPHDNATDPINLRCFDQKRRFGFDFLYPIDRYVRGFTEPTIPNRAGEVVPNPLFTGGRPSDAVLFTAIVGVPWQDIAVDPKDLSKGYEAWNKVKWHLVLGDPTTLTPPTDPLMIESIVPRTGVQPIIGAELAPPTALPLANPINGHERVISANDDLQYACIFERPTFKACNSSTPDCECKSTDLDTNPLCQAPDGTYTNIQRWSKGLPGVRELTLVRDLGKQGVAASICADVVKDAQQPTFGYKPAADALLRSLRPLVEPSPQEASPGDEDGP
jgi:hypothetical protein